MTENNSVETTLSDFERKKLVEQIYIAFPRSTASTRWSNTAITIRRSPPNRSAC